MTATSPLRVLHVVSALGMGGAETWLIELLRYWSLTGAVHMDFLATSGQLGVFDEEAERLGARIHYVKYERRTLVQFVRRIRHIMVSGNYDAVHDHQDYVSGWHFLFCSGVLPATRISHIHNPSYQILLNYGVSAGRRLTTRIGKSLMGRFATNIAATSQQVIEEYGLNAPAFRHIPKAAIHCGFNTRRFLIDRRVARDAICREFNWPDDAVIALFAGRIDRSPDPSHAQAHKNAGFAVDVAIEARSKNPRLHLLLAGAMSPAVPILRQRIEEAGFAGSIAFAGVRRDIETLMTAADVLLFPSRAEGLGMVAVEAQSAGLPVLASTGVPRECVVVPKLVRFRDLALGKTAWAMDLLDLAEIPRDTKKANLSVAQSNFSIERSAAALQDIYARD